MNTQQRVWDVVVRSVKTALAAYLAFVAAGGFNIIHVSSTTEAKIAGIAAMVTALLNIMLQVHDAITNPTVVGDAPQFQLTVTPTQQTSPTVDSVANPPVTSEPTPIPVTDAGDPPLDPLTPQQ